MIAQVVLKCSPLRTAPLAYALLLCDSEQSSNFDDCVPHFNYLQILDLNNFFFSKLPSHFYVGKFIKTENFLTQIPPGAFDNHLTVLVIIKLGIDTLTCNFSYYFVFIKRTSKNKSDKKYINTELLMKFLELNVSVSYLFVR